MKNRRFDFYLFLLSFLLITAIALYFYLVNISNQNIKKETKLEKTKKTKLEPNIENKNINWKDFLPEIKKIISQKFPDINLEEELFIVKELDINKDGINEAVIDLGYSGASTESFAIFKLNKMNKLELIKLKDKDGNIKEEIFVRGVGGAGRYGFNFDFLPEYKAIYKESFYAYNSPNDFCKVEVFSYNPREDYFEYSEELSKELTEKYCKELCSSISEELKDYFINICKF